MRPKGTRSRARARARLLLALGGLTACASAAPDPPGPSAAAPVESRAASAQPVAAVFTVAQADRGQRVYTTVCSACHGRNEFTGPIFGFTWMVEPVGNLFQHISTKMPQDRPGSLAPEEYAAVVAYLLELNGRPAGDTELPSDPALLDDMRW